MELWQFSNDKGVRSQATLLTRNLCFYGPTKTLLASNGIYNRALHYDFIGLSFCVGYRKFLDPTTIWIEIS